LGEEGYHMAKVENSCFVTDEEMRDILEDKELINSLAQSVREIKERKFRIIE
jgi:hypothetical protein